MKFISKAQDAFYLISRWSFYAGALFLAAMVLITTADVVGRYIFNSPVRGSLEMIEYLMVLIGALGLGWATLMGVHLAVDIVVKSFKQRIQVFFNIVTHTLCLVIFALISKQTIVEALNSLLVYKDASTILKIPAFPFYFILAFGFIMLCIAIIFKLIHLIGKLVKE